MGDLDPMNAFDENIRIKVAGAIQLLKQILTEQGITGEESKIALLLFGLPVRFSSGII